MPATYKAKLSGFVKSLRDSSSSKSIQDELDAVSELLKRPEIDIPTGEEGRIGISHFLLVLFTKYPQLMTDANKLKVMKLSDSIFSTQPELEKPASHRPPKH